MDKSDGCPNFVSSFSVAKYCCIFSNTYFFRWKQLLKVLFPMRDAASLEWQVYQFELVSADFYLKHMN